ncbi:MAG: hypothetical protein AUI93_05640 [Crenarchaeota archaeon 13_1_40CM_3_52_10]|nr:MAG: hypothetical protein AUI93_05640 [Crenarchaeota archaeon 13_1_40CM_3_52_10]
MAIMSPVLDFLGGAEGGIEGYAGGGMAAPHWGQIGMPEGIVERHVGQTTWIGCVRTDWSLILLQHSSSALLD